MAMIHKYERLAKKVVFRVWASTPYWNTTDYYSLSARDREECERVAVLAICKVAKLKPHYAENAGYLHNAARNSVLKFLLNKRNGWLNQLSVARRKESCFFVEDNMLEIYNLLLSSRSKKGKRGSDAASRDLQIILLASLGWENKEIGEELDIMPDNVKKYRQAIVSRLSKILEDKNANL